MPVALDLAKRHHDGSPHDQQVLVVVELLQGQRCWLRVKCDGEEEYGEKRAGTLSCLCLLATRSGNHWHHHVEGNSQGAAAASFGSGTSTEV